MSRDEGEPLLPRSTGRQHPLSRLLCCCYRGGQQTGSGDAESETTSTGATLVGIAEGRKELGRARVHTMHDAARLETVVD
jgi:hypothetical protein